MRLGLQTGSVLGTPHVFLVPSRPSVPPSLSLSRLGDVSNQQISSLATVGATTTVGILTALHATLLGLTFTGPIGAAITGAITALGAVATVIAAQFQGCGQTCIQASNDANKFEPYLEQNLGAYLNSPIHYASLQAAALNNFDTLWAALSQACSDPALQDAGRRCISDRQRGACVWKASFTGWEQSPDGKWTYTGFGPAGSGNTCFNWFVGYRDPIANDPSVVPDPVPGVGTATGTDPVTGLPTNSGSGSSSGGISPLLLIGGAALLLAAVSQ